MSEVRVVYANGSTVEVLLRNTPVIEVSSPEVNVIQVTDAISVLGGGSGTQTTVNNFSGDISLVAGDNIEITDDGESTITISATFDAGVTSLNDLSGDISITAGDNIAISDDSSGLITISADLSAATITYTNANPTEETIGGIVSGTTFDAVSMQDMWTALLYPYQNPTFSVNDNFASQYQYGDEVSSVEITLVVTNQSNVDDGTLSLSINQNGSLSVVETGLSISDFPYTYTPVSPMTADPNDYISFRVSGLDTNGGTVTGNGPSTYWRHKLFWGNNSSNTIDQVSILSGSTLDSDRKGVRSFPAGNGVYKYIAIPISPESLGIPPAAPNGFKLVSGINVPMLSDNSEPTFDQEENGYNYRAVTQTINGKSVTYAVFRSYNQLNGELTIEVF